MEAAGGAPRDWAKQVEVADALPLFTSKDIWEKERAAKVVKIKLMAETNMLMVKEEQCSADNDWHKTRLAWK